MMGKGEVWPCKHGKCHRYICPCIDCCAEAEAEVVRLTAEVDRLKRGDFTPEEFQTLCHHRDEKPGCTRADFEAGCQAYQRQLFGDKP